MCPRGFNRATRKSETNFTIQGLQRRCAPNTETTAVKPRVGIEGLNRSPRGVCSLLKWRRAGGPMTLPALLISRLRFSSKMSSCQVGACARPPSGAIPGSRTNLLTGCASARGRVSKTQLTPGSTEAACQIVNHKFFPRSWQTSNALALQAG